MLGWAGLLVAAAATQAGAVPAGSPSPAPALAPALAQGQRRMTYGAFVEALELLAQARGCSIVEVRPPRREGYRRTRGPALTGGQVSTGPSAGARRSSGGWLLRRARAALGRLPMRCACTMVSSRAPGGSAFVPDAWRPCCRPCGDLGAAPTALSVCCRWLDAPGCTTVAGSIRESSGRLA